MNGLIREYKGENTMLGIIGAMDQEMDALFARMQDVTEEKIGFSRFLSGTLEGVPCVLSRCGVGKVHAAACAQAMLMRYRPEAVINIGVAGALMDALSIRDIVIAENAVQHDMDTSPIGDPKGLVSGINLIYFPCDAGMRRMMAEAAEEAGLAYMTAGIATGDRFVSLPEEKRAIAREFGAGACDMEGCAIAQVCLEMDVPYAAYRAISDTVTGTGLEYLRTAQEAADASAALLHIFLRKWREKHE